MFKKGFLAFFAAALLMANGSVAEAAEIMAMPEAQVMETSVSGGDVFVGMVEETVLDGGTVEVEVMSTSTDLTISSNYTLTEDTSVAGDLTITAGTMNLNGYTLTVGGDVIFTAGTLDINEGKLDISGNFSMGSKGTVGTTRYATSTGVLVMNDAADVVVVGGDYEICNAYQSTLTKGTMYIGGNFEQYGTYYDSWIQAANARAFNASGNHKVVFTDDASHSIFFESTYSGFGKVDFGNSEIVLLSDIRGFTLCDDTTWKIDTVDSAMGISGTVDLDGHTLTVNGDMDITSGAVDLNEGCLTVHGNFSIGTKGELSGTLRKSTSKGLLVMDDKEDKVVIEGDFTICSSYVSTFTAGNMYIDGNFAQYGNEDMGSIYAHMAGFNAGKSHMVIFSEDKEHSIYFDSTDSGFGKVDFGNGEIEIESPVRGFALYEDAEWNLKLPSDELGFGGTMDLNGYNLTINADVDLKSGAVDINEGTLKVNGSLSIGKKAEMNGALRAANSSATLVMDDEEDEVIVNGSFEICSSKLSTLSGGTMYIAGDFAQYGAYDNSPYTGWSNANSFNAGGVHKVVFAKDKPHTIYFESGISGFKNVDFGNGELKFSGVLRGYALQEDAEWNLKPSAQDVKFAGTMDLNGHKLTVNNSINLTGGTLDINEGCLEVKGDLSLGNKGEATGEYYKATSGAKLIMDDAADTIIVNGDYESCTYGISTLSNGIMYISGDFAQYGKYSGGYDYANWESFHATGSHKVILCGTEKQSVLFEYRNYSHFATLELHMPTENYTFNPDGCWDTLIPYTTVQVRNFVERMYTVALNRASDPSGVAYWTDVLVAKEYDGASLSAGFILGEEFTGKNYSNDEFVKVLYSTFFSREADDAGKAYWSGLLESGSSRASVLAGFVNSNEFFALCGEYGISRGMLRGDGSAINPGIYQFAERLYSKIFERNGDKDGIEYWTMQIDSRESTPENAAMGFFFSPEYVEKNTSDDDYIKALYRTFMGREADDSGLTYWKGEMANGATRAHVLASFAQSSEFKGIMAEYGL